MRGLLKMVEYNEKDNTPTKLAKGGLLGWATSSAVSLTFIGTCYVIGKLINREDEVEAFEEEMRAE